MAARASADGGAIGGGAAHVGSAPGASALRERPTTSGGDGGAAASPIRRSLSPGPASAASPTDPGGVAEGRRPDETAEEAISRLRAAVLAERRGRLRAERALKELREESVRGFAAEEMQEEAITNKLLAEKQALLKEKETLAQSVDAEEEALTLAAQRKMAELEAARLFAQKKLEEERAAHLALEQKLAALEQSKREKEKRVQEEQHAVTHTLAAKLDELQRSKDALERRLEAEHRYLEKELAARMEKVKGEKAELERRLADEAGSQLEHLRDSLLRLRDATQNREEVTLIESLAGEADALRHRQSSLVSEREALRDHNSRLENEVTALRTENFRLSQQVAKEHEEVEQRRRHASISLAAQEANEERQFNALSRPRSSSLTDGIAGSDGRMSPTNITLSGMMSSPGHVLSTSDLAEAELASRARATSNVGLDGSSAVQSVGSNSSVPDHVRDVAAAAASLTLGGGASGRTSSVGAVSTSAVSSAGAERGSTEPSGSLRADTIGSSSRRGSISSVDSGVLVDPVAAATAAGGFVRAVPGGLVAPGTQVWSKVEDAGAATPDWMGGSGTQFGMPPVEPRGTVGAAVTGIASVPIPPGSAASRSVSSVSSVSSSDPDR